MSRNAGAWGVVMWQNNKTNIDEQGNIVPDQAQGIALSGGDPVDPFLESVIVGCLLLPPDGLGVPPVRSGDVAFAQRDGVQQFGDYYEPRQLTFEVSVCNDGCPGCSPTPPTLGVLVLDGVAPGRAFTSSLTFPGDIDLRAHAALDDWTPGSNMAFITQFIGTERSFIFQVTTTGHLRLIWTTDGTAGTQVSATSTVPLTVTDGQSLFVRVTLDVDNGAAGRDIMFYTSGDGFTWTQLGAVVTQAGVTSIHPGTADVEIGSHSNGSSDRLIGNVFSAEIRSVIDGSVVANPDFTIQSPGTTSFVDGVGNTWSVVAPAVIQGIPGPAPLTARQKVKRLTTEWSRSCASATLVLFPDCYDPGATEEEKTYGGAYLVNGRPRVAELTWMRSNRGCARLTLRFDAQDARLILADTTPGPGNWSGTHVASAGAGAAAGGNIAQDYRHDDVVWDTQDAVATQSSVDNGAPDGGSYRSISITTPNTVSPMQAGVGGTATSGIPVTAGNDYSFTWWARQNPVGGVSTRVDAAWWDAGGSLITTTVGANMAATTDWSQFTQVHTAPALAAFMQPVLRWSGIALAGQDLATAQLWVNEGAAATAPETVEVVGDLCVFPVFRLDGPLTGPIEVFYGPFSFTYDEDIAAGELVTVDTRWGRASGGSADLTQNLLGTYDFPLSPGVHDFSFTTGDPADTGSVQIEWENAVISG